MYNVHGTSGAGLVNTQANQIDRIKEGVRDGSLTEAEAVKLLDQQARISGRISSAQADGVVTAAERRGISSMEAQASRAIYRERHDAQRANPAASRGVVDRQVNQLERISDGVRGGALSGRETAGLLREQAGIARTVSRAQADGRVNLFERAGINARQDRASGNIFREKHDWERGTGGRCPPLPPLPIRPGVSEEQARQLDRIAQGVSSGSLTESEAAKLLAQQERISQAVAAARADGVVTLAERRAISSMQGQASRDIYREKHDFQRANPWANRDVVSEQANQIHRIAQGVRSGSLNACETAALVDQQENIARSAAAANADGWVSPFERFGLKLQQFFASWSIFQLKHNWR